MSIASALGLTNEQLFGKQNACQNCKWYAEFEGVCCNGDSEHVADFRDKDFYCEEFEKAEVQK